MELEDPGRWQIEGVLGSLLRIVEVADRISAGTADRGVAHATGGQLLQQNLVCVLEGES